MEKGISLETGRLPEPEGNPKIWIPKIGVPKFQLPENLPTENEDLSYVGARKRNLSLKHAFTSGELNRAMGAIPRLQAEPQPIPGEGKASLQAQEPFHPHPAWVVTKGPHIPMKPPLLLLGLDLQGC